MFYVIATALFTEQLKAWLMIHLASFAEKDHLSQGQVVQEFTSTAIGKVSACMSEYLELSIRPDYRLNDTKPYQHFALKPEHFEVELINPFTRKQYIGDLTTLEFKLANPSRRLATG